MQFTFTHNMVIRRTLETRLIFFMFLSLSSYKATELCTQIRHVTRVRESSTKNPKSQQQQPNQQTNNNQKNLVNRPSRTIARLDNDNCQNSVMPNGILKKFIADTQTHRHTHTYTPTQKHCANSVRSPCGAISADSNPPTTDSRFLFAI